MLAVVLTSGLHCGALTHQTLVACSEGLFLNSWPGALWSSTLWSSTLWSSTLWSSTQAASLSPGLGEFLKGLWAWIQTYWVFLVILLAVLFGMWISWKASGQKEQKNFLYWMVQAIGQFLWTVIRLILQSPILIFLIVLLVLTRSGKLSNLLQIVLRAFGLRLPGAAPAPPEDYVDFEAIGEAPDSESLKKLMEEGKALLIPPLARIREIAPERLQDFLRGKTRLSHKMGWANFLYQSLTLPDIGRSFTLPLWVRAEDILAVAMDGQGEITVFVAKSEQPSPVKEEWDKLFGIGS